MKLPRNWGRAKLADILSALESGSRPRGGVKGIHQGIPSLGGEHLDANGGFRTDNIRFVPEEFASNQRRGWIAAGDILVVKDGATTGKTSFVGPDFPYERALINEHVFRCQVPSSIVSRYAFYWLHSARGNQQVLADFRGAAQGGISQAFANYVELPIAPAREQTRIVDAIESYFTRLDDAVATLERAQRNLKRYRSSVLKAAVEGRLVPTEAELARAEGRSYEPASVLLTRILAERRRRWEEVELAKMTAKGKTPKDDKWRAKYVEPVAPDTSELPSLPEGWCWTTLSELAALIVDGTHHTPTYANEGVPFISVKDVRGGTIHFDDCKYIGIAEHAELTRRCKPERGDLLVTKSGTIGRTAVVRTDAPFSLFVSVALLKPASGEISPEWLEAAFLYWLQGKNISQDVKGSAIKNLHLEDFRSIAIPLPPLLEQQRIVAEMSQVFTVCEHSACDIARTSSKVSRMRQSILKWAFEGRLVDQDPTDEPASILLDRIRAERASTIDTPLRRARRANARAPRS